jgi:hypothetical protein
LSEAGCAHHASDSAKSQVHFRKSEEIRAIEWHIDGQFTHNPHARSARRAKSRRERWSRSGDREALVSKLRQRAYPPYCKMRYNAQCVAAMEVRRVPSR